MVSPSRTKPRAAVSSVALIDASDFGSGASFNHQKTVHGGLRSLQSARLDRALEAIRERRALARIAPWLLRPLPFLVGTYRSVARNRLALRAAFKIDQWLGRKRNVGVEPELHLPAPRLVSKAATLRLFAGIRQEGLTGGAQWYDYQMVEADRLTLAFAAAADAAGATIANYVEALEPVREGGRIAGMTAKDQITGRTISIKARAVVNAAGSHAGIVMQRFGVKRELPMLRALNLLTSRRASDMALAAPTSAGRMLTLVPWHGLALIGTSQSKSMVQPDDLAVTAGEIESFIAEANEAFPALKLTREDVTLVHRGVVPAVAGRNGTPELRPAPAIYDHASESAEGAFTVVGVKYTTARIVAERAVNMIGKRLSSRLRPSRSATTVLPGAGIADHEALTIETARALNLEMPLPVIRHSDRAVRGGFGGDRPPDRRTSGPPGASQPRGRDHPGRSPARDSEGTSDQAQRHRDSQDRSGIEEPSAGCRHPRVRGAGRSRVRVGRAAHQRRDSACAGILRAAVKVPVHGTVKPLNTQVKPAVKP